MFSLAGCDNVTFSPNGDGTYRVHGWGPGRSVTIPRARVEVRGTVATITAVPAPESWLSGVG